jgi:hypothetical protein
VERRSTEITYTVYYSTTRDTIPPSIWEVRTLPGQDAVRVEVEVTDFSGVVRTVVAYTAGDGIWQTVELTQSPDPNLWVGVLPKHARLEFFVQTVDGGGNVAIHDNKGRYFVLNPARLYLPLILQP